MKLILAWLGFCAALVSAWAAPLFDEPVPELKLKSGTTLRQAVAKSFTQQGVVVRHAGGFATVRYTDFPEPHASLLEARRPAPKSADELAKEAADREARVRAEKARSEAASRALAQNNQAEPVRANGAHAAQRAGRGTTKEEELSRYRRGGLRLVSYQVNATGVIVNVINETDYGIRLDWRQLRGIRAPGDFVPPLEARPTNGTDDFTVPGRSRISFQLIFSEHAQTPIRGVDWN